MQQMQPMRAVPPVGLTPVDPHVQMARTSRPWRMYGRVVALVVLTFFVVMGVADSLIIALLEDAWVGAMCAGFTLPFLLGLAAMRRPRLVLLERAVPDRFGRHLHPISSHAGSLQTPMPTRLGRHLMRDDSVLDVPETKQAWALFAITVAASIAVNLVMVLGNEALAAFAVLALIPLILVGFSIPVMAWWSHSTERIGLPTKAREAESWLMAGMFSAFPAVIINSLIFPATVLFLMPDASAVTVERLTVVISAPVGEELFKAGAIALFLSRIRSPRHGFQIGFTVGLGFAILENLMYIAGSLGEPLTMLVRGIGSIPGHAFWTGLSGAAIGWVAMRRQAARMHAAARAGHRIAPPKQAERDWQLVDSKTGARMETPGSAQGVALAPSGIHMWTPVLPTMEKPAWVKVPTPKQVWVGLPLAMAGHAGWNGTLTVFDMVSGALGWSTMVSFILSLLVMSGMVILLLVLGSGLLASIREAPDGSELDAYQAELAAITRTQ